MATQTAFMELRLPLLIRTVHGMALPHVESFLRQNPQLGIDPDALPAPEELERLLDDVQVSIAVDQEGFALRQRSPMGFGLGLAALGAATDWLLARAGSAAAGQEEPQARRERVY
jgi:hypothetical protein